MTEIKAGRELDGTIAVKVMGWTSGTALSREMFPHYSTDISAAWLVVEKITALKRDAMGWFDLRFANGRWEATFLTGAYYEPIEHVRSNTAPHAICLAALKVVGAA